VIDWVDEGNAKMLMGRVVGTAQSTIKHASMNRQKLLVIQPLMTDGQSPDGDPLIAVDGVGAGVGERVMLTSDGRFARDWLNTRATPVRWAVIAIEDEMN
jgi:ethanolamine utilization protein EutN